MGSALCGGPGDYDRAPAPEARPWPGYCQACGAALDPPDARYCRACHASDDDE